MSTFLHDVVEVGDELEVRGPLGGFFVWDGATPALLVGGGSGVVPLMAMLRLARRTGRADLVRMVVSARAPDDLLYASGAAGPGDDDRATPAPTPPGWTRAAGRADGRRTSRRSPSCGDVTAYVCGSAGFCNTAGDLLVALGQPVDRIRIERFGPTG